MKVLVTGGAGFIGAHLVRALVSAGDTVTILDNFHRGARSAVAHAEQQGRVRFVEGDIRDLASVRNAAAGVQKIFHLAAQSNVLGAVSDVDYSFTTNVVGTYNVLLAARDEGVERMVFTSSREAYGEVDVVPVSEDRPLLPKNAYGASKVAGEVYCRTFQNTYGLDVSVLRLANVYGFGDRDRVIPIWLERASQGRDLELYGGQQVLDFVPVDVVVCALLRAADISLGGQPVNVGSGTGVTLHALAARVQQLAGGKLDLRILPARSVEVTRYVADASRMRTMLGIEPPDQPLGELAALWEKMERPAA